MNILEANKKQDNHLSNYRNLGVILCILTGFIGCCVIKDGGSSFGWTFSALGFVLCCYMNYQKYQLKLGGGALTKRKLVEEDLEGLNKQELERMRLHIFAKHGYNFNVNDGLYYFDKIAKQYLSDHQIINTLPELDAICKTTGCDQHDILAANHYKEFHYSPKPLEEMTEKEKDKIRKYIEEFTFSVIDEATSTCHYFQVTQIGRFNRYNESGHEGIHYYDFKDCDWYNPTTSDINEIYRKMSDVEKYNVEFIKAQEAKCL